MLIHNITCLSITVHTVTQISTESLIKNNSYKKQYINIKTNTQNEPYISNERIYANRLCSLYKIQKALNEHHSRHKETDTENTIQATAYGHIHPHTEPKYLQSSVTNSHLTQMVTLSQC